MQSIAEEVEKELLIPWQGVRPDLVLFKGAPMTDGEDSFVLEDPVQGAHFELGESETQLFLCLASEQDIKPAITKLFKDTSLRPEASDIISFIYMLQREKLAVLPPEIAIGEFDTQKKPSIWMKIMTGYLFFKIPLIRPDSMLNALNPWIGFLWSGPFMFLCGVLGVSGLIFVAQDIELYINTVNHLFTAKGALAFLVGLTTVKIIHEFAHAFVAKRCGLFVRRMGLAFMVFMPILYTDTTEAWKLPDKRDRMLIGAAGIFAEIAVGAVALFFWSILPDGVLRSVMFYLSGASIVSTLFTNLNPLLKYDGYYLLMDYIGVSNLRIRSIAMFKYFRHRVLVDWRGPKPEEHPKYRALAVFGLFSTMYRFIIFLGITLAVYHFFFKALGAILVILQIVLTLIVPLIMETIFLMKNRQHWGAWYRIGMSGAGLVVIIGLFFAPLPEFETLPALFLYKNVAEIKAPGPGRISAELPKIGTRLKKNKTLFAIENDEGQMELVRKKYELDKVETLIKRMGGGGEEGGYRKWLLTERERLIASMGKIKQGLEQLAITPPVSGVVMAINETLMRGSYVSNRGYLLTVGNSDSFEVRAYAPEDVYQEMKKNRADSGWIFINGEKTVKIKAKIKETQDFPVNEFPNDSLFDYAGGDILSLQNGSGGVRPRQAYYPIVFDIKDALGYLPHGLPCYARIEGTRGSYFSKFVKWSVKTLSAEGIL